MTLENAEAIVEFLEDEGIEARVYKGYSGRGMYGKTTSGIVTEDPNDVAWAMGRLDIDDSRAVDEMGLRAIVY